MIVPKLSRTEFQQWVEEHFAHPTNELGQRFLAVHFPHVDDYDLLSEGDHTRAIALIEERYVQS